MRKTSSTASKYYTPCTLFIKTLSLLTPFVQWHIKDTYCLTLGAVSTSKRTLGRSRALESLAHQDSWGRRWNFSAEIVKEKRRGSPRISIFTTTISNLTSSQFNGWLVTIWPVPNRMVASQLMKGLQSMIWSIRSKVRSTSLTPLKPFIAITKSD